MRAKLPPNRHDFFEIEITMLERSLVFTIWSTAPWCLQFSGNCTFDIRLLAVPLVDARQDSRVPMPCFSVTNLQSQDYTQQRLSLVLTEDGTNGRLFCDFFNRAQSFEVGKLSRDS